MREKENRGMECRIGKVLGNPTSFGLLVDVRPWHPRRRRAGQQQAPSRRASTSAEGWRRRVAQGPGVGGRAGAAQGRVAGYAAEIRIPSSRSRVWIGRFDHALQAALAYDAAMFLFYGQKLPKLRRYNFPATPRPNVPEVVRKGLTVANVKAIAEKHGRSFGHFLPLPPAPMIPAAPPAVAPSQMAEAGGAAASMVHMEYYRSR
ncbi:hypothetical protein PVAP13_6NG303300 [Panicum virgatum]|uniref:AP2/ERF domain-containing protein n=1 Tax=Panicum virgatum TaxID=38727 RepID=A0A8T0R3R2_PANVG|nr:hypothetical protein PVAP13_6NG303300 [Panicum virgatum]